MKEEQVMRDVEFSPEEVPGFDTRGGAVKRDDYVRGRVKNPRIPLSFSGWRIGLYQTLERKGTGVRGKDPTRIAIWAHLWSDRNLAYQDAESFTESQLARGFPEGSFTGVPIGEKSWASAPKTGRVSLAARLVVWDGRLAVRIDVDYPPLDPKARNLQFLAIDQQDLQLGEYAARLLISKVKRRLLGSRELPRVRLVVEGKTIGGMKTSERTALVPTRATLKGLGQKATIKLGILTSSWKGQKVVIATGARSLLVGKQKVSLSLPVLYEKEEVWVEGEALAKALGLKAQWEKGQFVLAKR